MNIKIKEQNLKGKSDYYKVVLDWTFITHFSTDFVINTVRYLPIEENLCLSSLKLIGSGFHFKIISY